MSKKKEGLEKEKKWKGKKRKIKKGKRKRGSGERERSSVLRFSIVPGMVSIGEIWLINQFCFDKSDTEMTSMTYPQYQCTSISSTIPQLCF